MRASPLLLLLSVVAAAQTGTAVKYHATIDDVKYVYGMAAPVAHSKSGDIIETTMLDAFGNALKKPGDRLSTVKGDNPLTGPSYIDGAQPGDTLAVRILDVQPDGNQGVGNPVPGFGALNQTTYTVMLHTPLPERIWFDPIDKATMAYIETLKRVRECRRDIQRVFKSVDLLVLPTMREPAPLISETVSETHHRPQSNTSPFNHFGTPALTLPCGFSKEGRPIGLQIVGAAYHESAVLQLAYAYQESTDWHRRTPPVVS
jgi:hypothetical protein